MSLHVVVVPCKMIITFRLVKGAGKGLTTHPNLHVWHCTFVTDLLQLTYTHDDCNSVV